MIPQPIDPGPRPRPAPPAGGGPIVGRTLGGRYRVLGALREGGKKVFRAEQSGLARPVAVTILKPAPSRDMSIFRRNASAAINVDHPNVVRILDFGEEPDGLLFVVSELAGGMDLATVLRELSSLPPPRVIAIMQQVAAALTAAQEHGVVHGDVRPERIILCPSRDDEGKSIEQAKLWGFGLRNEPFGADGKYTSPERIRGTPPDASTDIFSCGVILYEMATGKHPFGGGQPTGSPPRPPTAVNAWLDPALEDVIMTAMQREPSARFDSPRSLRSALRALQSPRAPLQAQSLPPEPPRAAPPEPAARAPVVERAPTPPHQPLREPAPEFKIPLSQQATSRDDALEFDFSVADRIPDNPEQLGALHTQPAWVQLEVLTNTLAQDPAKALAPLDGITDLGAYIAEMARLEKPITTLGHRGETIALWSVICWLAERARGVAPTIETREGIASHLIVGVLGDVEKLGPIARVALSTAGLKHEAARRILAGGGSVGAAALIGARERAAKAPPVGASREERARFVAALGEIGLPAIPAIIASINQRPPPDAPTIEDLLDGMGAFRPPQPGAPIDPRAVKGAELAIALFAQPIPGIRRACAGALATLLGPHANVQLVAILDQATDDGARIAALEALGRTGGIDRNVVFKIDAMMNEPEATPALRTAAAVALGHTPPAARPAAAGVLARALKPSGNLLTKLVGNDAETVPVIVAIARTFLEIGGEDAADAVEARAARSSAELKRQLLALIAEHYE